VEAFRLALLYGCVTDAHEAQGDARWVIFTDGACERVADARVASWAFAVLERIGSSFQFAGARSGRVYGFDSHPWFLGTDMPTNNTSEIEALGHALAWISTLSLLAGEVLLISDSSHA
jgi:ribonuclease HI